MNTFLSLWNPWTICLLIFLSCRGPFFTVVFNTNPQILPRVEELRADKTWRIRCGFFCQRSGS